MLYCIGNVVREDLFKHIACLNKEDSFLKGKSVLKYTEHIAYIKGIIKRE